MEVRDALYGSVWLSSLEQQVLDTKALQRLRRIQQLGFANQAYPGATHTRLSHSIGAMHVASWVLRSLQASAKLGFSRFSESTFSRFEPLIRACALLHDIGHGPLSHSSESAMPYDQKLQRKRHHEDYTALLISYAPLQSTLDETLSPYGWNSSDVLAVLVSGPTIESDRYICEFEGQPIQCLPLLRQIISGEIDCDRMDYLQRDSHYVGVRYGFYDRDWILQNLTFYCIQGAAYLGLKNRALSAFEDFLLSRYHMFVNVYNHHKSSAYDETLRRFLVEQGAAQGLPLDPAEYLTWDDAKMWDRIGKEREHSEWAHRLVEGTVYRLAWEAPQGFPADQRDHLIAKWTGSLTAQGIPHWVLEQSQGITKSTEKPSDFATLYVELKLPSGDTETLPVSACTQLYDAYQNTRTAKRLYVAPENFAKARGLAPRN